MWMCFDRLKNSLDIAAFLLSLHLQRHTLQNLATTRAPHQHLWDLLAISSPWTTSEPLLSALAMALEFVRDSE